MSSPVLATTTSSSAPTTSSMPRARFAPPVPPASTTTGPVALTGPDPRRSMVQAGDPDPRPDLVAHVDRDEQRRQLLDDARHLQRAAVDAAEPVDEVHQLDDPGLVGLAVAADQHVLVEHVIEIGEQGGADGVKGRDDADSVGDHLLGL